MDLLVEAELMRAGSGPGCLLCRVGEESAQHYLHRPARGRQRRGNEQPPRPLVGFLPAACLVLRRSRMEEHARQPEHSDARGSIGRRGPGGDRPGTRWAAERQSPAGGDISRSAGSVAGPRRVVPGLPDSGRARALRHHGPRENVEGFRRCGIGLLGWPASESGRLRYGDGGHGRGDHR